MMQNREQLLIIIDKKIVKGFLYSSYERYLKKINYTINFLGRGVSGVSVCITTRENMASVLQFTPEDAEITTLKLLNKEILFTQLSPHIILYLMDAQLKRFPRLFKKKNDNIGLYLAEKSISLLKKNKINAVMSEFARLGDLRNYIISNSISLLEIQIIFFQILYTLAQIRRVFPHFQHGDLNFSNILLQENEHYGQYTRYIYQYGEHSYEIPVLKYQIKLWDFEVSKIEFDPEHSIYRDLEMLLKEFIGLIEDKETLNFMQEILSLRKIPEEIIVRDYFNCFKVEKTNILSEDTFFYPIR